MCLSSRPIPKVSSYGALRITVPPLAAAAETGRQHGPDVRRVRRTWRGIAVTKSNFTAETQRAGEGFCKMRNDQLQIAREEIEFVIDHWSFVICEDSLSVLRVSAVKK